MSKQHAKQGFFCRDEALAQDEALLGTAGPKQIRILLQDHSPWTRKGFDDCALPEAIKNHLKALFDPSEKPAIVLIRNHNRRQLRDKSIFIVHSTERDACVYHYQWQQPGDLQRLPLADAMARRVPPNFHQPLYLVCTNGKRDKCCAKYGMPLYKQLSLSLGAKVWRSTHLGGDRFAANMLCLPHGLLYGRLTERTATKAVHYYEQGKVSVQGLRGRSCYSKPVQVAEAYVRAQAGINGLDRLQLLAAERVKDSCCVRFCDKQSGSNYDLMVRITQSSVERKLTCVAEHKESVPNYQVAEFSSSRSYL